MEGACGIFPCCPFGNPACGKFGKLLIPLKTFAGRLVPPGMLTDWPKGGIERLAFTDEGTF